MSNLNKTVAMNGNFELFDNPLLKIRGSLEGNLSNTGDLQLEGTVTNHGSFPMPEAKVTVTKSKVSITTSFLGSSLVLNLKKNGFLFLEGGPIIFEFQSPVSYVTDVIFDDIPHILSFDIKVKAEVNFKLVNLPPEISFKISGYVLDDNFSFKFSFTTDVIFKEIKELIDYVVDKVVKKIDAKDILDDLVIDHFCNLKSSLEDKLQSVLTDKCNTEKFLEKYAYICWKNGPLDNEYIPVPGYGCPIPYVVIEEAFDKLEELNDEIDSINNKIGIIGNLNFY